MTAGVGDRRPGRCRPVVSVFRRELVTIRRTPSYLVLGLALTLGTLGVALTGGGVATGYLPTVVDVMVWTEVAVPIAAIALGYRALLTDTKSGEFAVIRTYPVGIGQYLLGILLARAVAAGVMVIVAFGVLGGYVWLVASPDTGIYATHPGIDSPIRYGRFVVLTVWLGIVYLWLAIAFGAMAGSRRGALALATLVVAGGIVAGDIVITRQLAEGTRSVGDLATAYAITPNTAFRGMLFEYVVGVAFDPGAMYMTRGRVVTALLGWPLVGLLTAGAAMGARRWIGEFIRRIRM